MYTFFDRSLIKPVRPATAKAISIRKVQIIAGGIDYYSIRSFIPSYPDERKRKKHPAKTQRARYERSAGLGCKVKINWLNNHGTEPSQGLLATCFAMSMCVFVRLEYFPDNNFSDLFWAKLCPASSRGNREGLPG